jgi:uncharacterized membrane protein
MNNLNKSNLRSVILIIIGISILLALVPIADPGFDGPFETLLTGTDFIVPILWQIVLILFLLKLSQQMRLTSRPPFFSLILPPPIQ